MRNTVLVTLMLCAAVNAAAQSHDAPTPVTGGGDHAPAAKGKPKPLVSGATAAGRDEEPAGPRLRVPRGVKVLEIGARKIPAAAVLVRVVRQVDPSPPVEMEGKRMPAQIPCVAREVLVQGSEVLRAPPGDIPLGVEEVCPGGEGDLGGTTEGREQDREDQKKDRGPNAGPCAEARTVSCIFHRITPSWCREENPL